jgi:hypothetical protein
LPRAYRAGIGGGTAVIAMKSPNFWARPHAWPRDPTGYVFLARAVHAIGQARFGAEWTGVEVTTEFAKPLSRLATQEARRQYRAQRLINQRLKTVQQEIVTRCESGELVSAIRARAGGVMKVVPRTWWNTESLDNRFIMCQLSPSEPFGSAYAGDDFCWIFLTNESLQKYLQSQPFALVAANIDVHLSPYMKTMLAVAKRLSITPENQPKLEAVKAELRKCWTGSEPLSKRLLNAAATLLRQPESKLGRAKKRRIVD